MENTLPQFTRRYDRRILAKLALFCALFLALLGAPSRAQSQTLTMSSSDAHQFASALVKTTGSQDKLNSLAKILIKSLGDFWGWNVARIICYNGINTAVAARINWCADRASKVYIYTLYWIPYWADKA